MNSGIIASMIVSIVLNSLFYFAGYKTGEIVFGKEKPRVGECYTGPDPLAEIVEVQKFGVFWETRLPTNNPHAYTRYYATFSEFGAEFSRSDCWAQKEKK